MRIRRIVIAGLVGAALSSAVFAAAANLTVGTDTLGAGGASVASCDTNFTSAYVVPTSGDSAFKVTGVTVGDIAPSCAGGLLKVTVIDSTNAAIGAGEATVLQASSVTVSLSPMVDPEQIVGLRLAIVGGG